MSSVFLKKERVAQKYLDGDCTVVMAIQLDGNFSLKVIFNSVNLALVNEFTYEALPNPIRCDWNSIGSLYEQLINTASKDMKVGQNYFQFSRKQKKFRIPLVSMKITKISPEALQNWRLKISFEQLNIKYQDLHSKMMKMSSLSEEYVEEEDKIIEPFSQPIQVKEVEAFLDESLLKNEERLNFRTYLSEIGLKGLRLQGWRVVLSRPWDHVKTLNLNSNLLGDEGLSLLTRICWPSLKALVLDNNKIRRIEWNPAHLPKVDDIQTRGNKIKTLPQNIAHLQYLEKLGLNHNHFQQMPKELLTIAKLNKLWIDKNYIQNINESPVYIELISRNVVFVKTIEQRKLNSP